MEVPFEIVGGFLIPTLDDFAAVFLDLSVHLFEIVDLALGLFSDFDFDYSFFVHEILLSFLIDELRWNLEKSRDDQLSGAFVVCHFGLVVGADLHCSHDFPLFFALRAPS